MKALLFDLDGTLARTDAVHFPAWMEVLRPHGISVSREFYENRLAGRTNTDVVDDLLPDLSDEERRKLVEAEEKSSRRRTEHIGPLPGLQELLDEGRRRELTLALVTNSVKEDADQILRPLGLENAFDPVVYQREVENSKPEPEPYEKVLEKLNLRHDEVVAFEDSVTGARAAVAAGIRTVGIASTTAPEELLEAGAALVVGDFLDEALYKVLDS